MGRAADLFNDFKSKGESLIDEYIAQGISEELFLDFKRSGGKGPDRENLAKAISGFGNSEGGIVIWGVKCTKSNDVDLPSGKEPLKDVKGFLSWLEGEISGCTLPAHSGVENHCVTKDNSKEGFVITYIPESNHLPHQALHGKPYYYMRAGSNFLPVPHAVLAGMFGRRPQPEIFIDPIVNPAQLQGDQLSITIELNIGNKGLGIANDLFLSIVPASWVNDDVPGSTILFSFSDGNWIELASYTGKTYIGKPELRLPPSSIFRILSMTLFLKPPFTRPLLIDMFCGSGQSPTSEFKIENESSVINTLYYKFLDINNVLPAYKETFSLNTAKKILNID